MKMTVEIITSIISSIAAIGSALWAWSSARTSKRALKLAEHDAVERRESVKSYLINALRWKGDDDGVYASFACSFTNNSITPCTLERIDLVLHAFDITGKQSRTLVTPVRKMPGNSEFSLLDYPLNIPAKTTLSGWLTFPMRLKALGEHIVDRYEISGSMSSGSRVSLSCHLITEVAE